MMDVDPSFVSDGEASEAVEPGESTFDHPSLAADALAGLDAAAGDPWLAPAPLAGAAATAMIVGLVAMQPIWPSPWPAALAGNRRDCVEPRFEWHTVMHIRPGQEEGERDPRSVHDEVALGARPAAVGRIRPASAPGDGHPSAADAAGEAAARGSTGVNRR